MNCPKCRTEPMVQEVYAEIEVERCPVCKGLYLDRGELEGLIAKQQGNTADALNFSATSDAMDEVPAQCARCQRPMTPCVVPADVRIDWCSACGGVFLDQGELATLQLHQG